MIKEIFEKWKEKDDGLVEIFNRMNYEIDSAGGDDLTCLIVKRQQKEEFRDSRFDLLLGYTSALSKKLIELEDSMRLLQQHSVSQSLEADPHNTQSASDLLRSDDASRLFV